MGARAPGAGTSRTGARGGIPSTRRLPCFLAGAASKQKLTMPQTSGTTARGDGPPAPHAL
ncbi:hypothetical protein KH5H1_63630 [Corallococcus caeni]|uniref:Uncharacterized protein n=1 Tax=Corallococcus caeni TaxID=3082388 RepID=A0ABQ6QME9_9BACT|nr:hypothetical protein KH5H1_63630 [Corallococcus sp. KH5-1]GMU05185.1 hypothetical protein ASNO1_14370 [Corallococcus sp. NO1]